jgi:hypothetical protein
MEKDKRTKLQEFLEGHTIKSITHEPQTVIIEREDGKTVSIKAYTIGWDWKSNGLDFKYKE